MAGRGDGTDGVTGAATRGTRLVCLSVGTARVAGDVGDKMGSIKCLRGCRFRDMNVKFNEIIKRPGFVGENASNDVSLDFERNDSEKF